MITDTQEFKKIADDFKDLFLDIADDHGLNKESMTNISKHAAKIVAWRYTAKDDEEKRQADIAYEIMIKEIPITIKGMVSQETLARTIAKGIMFGLKVARVLMTL